MTLTELREIVRAEPNDWSARLTLSIAENVEGWITWLAIQSDIASEKAAR